MRAIHHAGTILLLLTMLLQSSSADVLVDTGPVSQLQHNVSLFNAGPGSYQFLAGKFTLNKPFNISSIEGLMYPPNGKLSIKLYSDVGGVPGTALFSGDFQFPQSLTAYWAVTSPLNWSRPAGTYWIAVEPHNGSDFGGMPGVVQHPLVAYAARTESFSSWFTTPGFGIGFRVNGTFVPEPGTMTLVLVAIGCSTAKRRRRPRI